MCVKTSWPHSSPHKSSCNLEDPQQQNAIICPHHLSSCKKHLLLKKARSFQQPGSHTSLEQSIAEVFPSDRVHQHHHPLPYPKVGLTDMNWLQNIDLTVSRTLRICITELQRKKYVETGNNWNRTISLSLCLLYLKNSIILLTKPR